MFSLTSNDTADYVEPFWVLRPNVYIIVPNFLDWFSNWMLEVTFPIVKSDASYHLENLHIHLEYIFKRLVSLSLCFTSFYTAFLQGNWFV